ncbi:MAG: 6-carboxytetrahydropterin synthase [Saprospiraceae bacterium]
MPPTSCGSKLGAKKENQAMFGKCSNRNWHGHNYELFVTVKGLPDPVTGFVMDVKELSNIIKREITDKVDHSNLNLDVDFIPKGTQPTTENLAILFWKQPSLYQRLPTALHQALRNRKYLCGVLWGMSAQ